MRLLTVSPLADGWRLSVDGVQNDALPCGCRALASRPRSASSFEIIRSGRGSSVPRQDPSLRPKARVPSRCDRSLRRLELI